MNSRVIWMRWMQTSKIKPVLWICALVLPWFIMERLGRFEGLESWPWEDAPLANALVLLGLATLLAVQFVALGVCLAMFARWCFRRR